MIKNKFSVLNILFASAIGLSTSAFALPAGQNQLRIQTSSPKRVDETAFSTLVSWRKGDSNLHRANGLIFIYGAETKNPTEELDIPRKAANALNGTINYDAPSERGAIAKYTENKKEFFISNQDGFDLSQITIRDYSNQELRYELPGKSFSAATVDVAIDFVYSAAVEYVEGFANPDKLKTVGGSIKVTLDDNEPVEIKTDNKTVEELEKELAQALSGKARFSSTPIYANYVELKSRNYKAFDGGEVQLSNLSAKSITIDVNDSGLGVLTKFKFPDENKPTDVANKMPYAVGFLVAAVLAYVFYMAQIKGKKEES